MFTLLVLIGQMYSLIQIQPLIYLSILLKEYEFTISLDSQSRCNHMLVQRTPFSCSIFFFSLAWEHSAGFCPVFWPTRKFVCSQEFKHQNLVFDLRQYHSSYPSLSESCFDVLYKTCLCQFGLKLIINILHRYFQEVISYLLSVQPPQQEKQSYAVPEINYL